MASNPYVNKVVFGANTIIDISDTTATADKILQGYGAYGADGAWMGGSITSQAAQTIHPSTTDQAIASGKYLNGIQTINAVLLTNLTAANIKKDVVVKVGDSTDDDCVASVTGVVEEAEIETGTYTPSSDAERPTISFAKTHSRLPSFISLIDTTDNFTISADSGLFFFFCSTESALNDKITYVISSGNVYRYGNVMWGYRTSSGSSFNGTNLNYSAANTGSSSNTYPRYYATESKFRPYCGSGRYWRTGRTYKWIAIWAPQST